MGRRSTGFTRQARDFYATPRDQALYLLPHLRKGTRYIEPCAGDGALIRHLQPYATCVHARDLEPLGPGILQADGADIGAGPEVILTNPPWSRHLLLPLIEAWLEVGRSMYLLLPGVIVFNGYWANFAAHTHALIPAGRPRWIAESKYTAKDDAAWIQLRPQKADFLQQRTAKGALADV